VENLKYLRVGIISDFVVTKICIKMIEIDGERCVPAWLLHAVSLQSRQNGAVEEDTQSGAS
jgi:hypothetical protein